VHVVFLSAEPPQDLLDRIAAAQSAAQAKGSPDSVTVAGRALFLHTPGGYGTSELGKLLASVKSKGVTITARNWATACKLLALCDGN
jgi:uncharacterized protein (DUF1697 family)